VKKTGQKDTGLPAYGHDFRFAESAVTDKPCWRVNGVWGNAQPRCEKLKFVAHCRNCDVFESAARAAIVENFDVSGPGKASVSFDDLVQQQRLSGDKSILPFRLESYCFAVPANKIITIHGKIAIHSIPFNRNPVIKGVVAIHHEIYSFVNIVELLALSTVEKNKKQKTKADGVDNKGSENPIKGLFKRVLVVDLNARKIAFYVDEVYPIYRYYHQAVNEVTPGSFFHAIAQGRLLKETGWCSDCHILDLDVLSNEFESSFL